METLNDFQSYFKLSDDDEIIQACWELIEKQQEKHYCSLLDILPSNEETASNCKTSLATKL